MKLKKKHKHFHRKSKIERRAEKMRRATFRKHWENKKKEKIEEKRKTETLQKAEKNSSVLESYKIDLDDAVVDVKIEKSGKGIEYKIVFPEIGIGTKALLEEVKKELVSLSTIGAVEMSDVNALNKIKAEFIKE